MKAINTIKFQDLHKGKFLENIEKKLVKFELVFIDGIHTDTNTFSDFLHTLEILKRDCIVLFHDTSIIFKSLAIINILLEKKNFLFKSRSSLPNKLSQEGIHRFESLSGFL